ncbi:MULTISPECIES: LysR family transcriptional regulator [Ralstonia solanacearum species complex]|uniref:LysR family transcriptional regulator n=2 Tax=Ralstonia solanacearum species complex TaxID=3116862 RepID=A0A0S4VAC3_RALSL|nr:LysR family transcriptional regulator [Ralstonia pseudosolanacearum]APC66314.1 LysR family transcriptional regulator [Ralstonia solanacearum OE1-1]AUS42242.1 LysR family transcriptional regulator [Ralstonia solanacearum]API77226.1 LysR family transcriptional regulator [Ralstonia pseudosolanacearum]AST89396.1 LysR family transcriptional regulator [Ralstonia pseudosolanacearum]AYA48850.1 LysR family transcriptional regulator [Ralstonia pseudosolanacearum]
MHFDFADLRLFSRIAEEQNLSRGARRAFLSPAAASARLKALEEQLGTRLFYRDNKGLSLTPAGEKLLRHARVIERQFEHVRSDFEEFSKDEVGHIRIFANTTAVTEFMPEVLATFMAERPAVTVDLQERLTRDIIRGVLDGSADLGIISGPIQSDELEVVHFSTDKLVLCTPVGHPLATADRGIAFADTLDYPHVSLHEGSTLHAFLTELVRDQRRRLQIRIQVRSFEAMCRMVETGVGIGVVPLSAALRHRKTMQLEIVELADAWAIRERAVIVRDLEGLPGCARALIDELMKVAQAAGGSS